MTKAMFLLLGSALVMAGAGAGVTTNVKAPAPPVDSYVPGLGDFMTAYVQPHHIKLWLAGSAGNWKLADYEAGELRETFDDISNYQATWKSVPVAQLVKANIEYALKGVEAAIAHQDEAAFKRAFVALTAGCNVCHKAAQHDFLDIKVPTGDPFSDQNFAAH
jgi:hypothetical protein